MAITYLCPVAKNHPIGGVKVIYRHAAILAANGVPASVFHPDDPGYRYDWFEHTTPMKADGRFNPAEDFVVIPEVWAGRFARTFYASGLKYAIFVQGGYSIPLALATTPRDEVETAYEKAALILSVSEDTSEIISLAYPRLPKDKIFRILPHVGGAFHAGKKAKIISYMPRKSPEQSHALRFFLESQPAVRGWEIVPIHNKKEPEVAETLARSSIFLAISHQEGFSLPPLEAALSGAVVVGYTGQGGKEYFHAPVFREIENGNLRAFVAGIGKAIVEVDNGLLDSGPFQNAVATLREKYSAANELAHLLTFARRFTQA
ncbi:MAG: hypothetical protein AB7E79_06435 [Rhodospirillaceae bacterium]